jgi:hypothetical protein
LIQENSDREAEQKSEKTAKELTHTENISHAARQFKRVPACHRAVRRIGSVLLRVDLFLFCSIVPVMPQVRALPSRRRIGPTVTPVLAVDGETARRALGKAAWPSERFAVVELPDRLGIGQLAPLMRKLRGRAVVVWPAPGAAGLARATRRAEMLLAAHVAAIGIATRKPDAPADIDAALDTALNEALARALPQQGFRPARAVMPWTGTVNPNQVLAEAKAALARHVELSPNIIEMMALWGLHAWVARDQASPVEFSPRLILLGLDPRAEHTRALRVLAWITPAPLVVSRAVASHVLPVLAAERPTLLLDDIAGGMLYRRDMRTLLAAGATQDGVFLSARTRRNPTGRSPCFAPTAIATLATLPDDVRRRSLILGINPPAPDAIALPLPNDPPEDVLVLRAQLQAAAAAIAPAIGDIPEATLREFIGQQRETLVPIMKLALAVGALPAEVAQIAQSATLDEETSAAQLLNDLHALYGACEDHIPTARMMDDLAALRGPGTVRDPNDLARRLLRFGLKPVSIRMTDQVVRGYRAGDLAATFARYLIAVEGATSSTEVAAA